MGEIKVVLCGVGGVGRGVARLLQARPGFEVVAAYTRNPGLVGLDLGELAGSLPSGVTVSGDRDAALSEPADILVVATTSFLKEVTSDVRAGVERGLNVICTAEEMAYPWIIDPDAAQQLDDLAQENEVTIVGGGANPGFIYEAVLLTLTGAAWDVERIRVRRVVNLSLFSETVLRRLGIGFDEHGFEEGVERGRIFGHIGFPQTIALLAAKIGVEIDDVSKSFAPLLATRPYDLPALRVEAGQTAGFEQRVRASVGARPWFEADFVGHVDPDSVGLHAEDVFEIDGFAPIKASVRPGFNAQLTSAAAIANSLRRVVEAPPGLCTVADLPPATASPTSRVLLKG